MDIGDSPDEVFRKALAAMRLAAMNLLARREYSRQELVGRLVAKFPEHDKASNVLAMALDKLEQEGLLCDARFAEAFLRSRARKGQGPYRIRQELQQRGVAEDLVEQTLAEYSVDWFELATRVAQKRFGTEPPDNYQERSKRARFLQYRGFSAEQIQTALDDRNRE